MRGMTAAFIVLIDPLQLGSKNYRLHVIEAAVIAYDIMLIAHVGTMVAQSFNFGSGFIGICRYQTAISESSQVFARKKAEASRMPDSAGLFTIDGGTEGLTAVFDQLQIVLIT